MRIRETTRLHELWTMRTTLQCDGNAHARSYMVMCAPLGLADTHATRLPSVRRIRRRTIILHIYVLEQVLV